MSSNVGPHYDLTPTNVGVTAGVAGTLGGLVSVGVDSFRIADRATEAGEPTTMAQVLASGGRAAVSGAVLVGLPALTIGYVDSLDIDPHGLDGTLRCAGTGMVAGGVNAAALGALAAWHGIATGRQALGIAVGGLALGLVGGGLVGAGSNVSGGS